MSPRTEAGKALQGALRDHAPWFLGGSQANEDAYIEGIEAEARALALEEVRAGVEEAIDECDAVGWDESRTTDLRPDEVKRAVLALLDRLSKGTDG